MLKVTLVVNDKRIKLPGLRKGKSGSFTDLADKALIMFTLDASGECAVLYRGHAQAAVANNTSRIIKGYHSQLLAVLRKGECHRLAVLTRYGQAALEFRLDSASTPHKDTPA